MNCRRGCHFGLVSGLELANVETSPGAGCPSRPPRSCLPQTIVAMITSNMARAGHASRVVVRVDSESAKGSGLLMDSVIMTDNLATRQCSEIDRILGTFPELRELDAALRTTLAL